MGSFEDRSSPSRFLPVRPSRETLPPIGMLDTASSSRIAAEGWSQAADPISADSVYTRLMGARTKTATILFTDLVSSTEILQRAGDERGEHIFRAHHRLLSDAVAAHRGEEVKWLGDGLMAAFDSVTDAITCAIAMQRASRRPTSGEHLAIRAGLNIGEVTVEGGDYFGSPVVVARRLCDRAESGQILASEIVVRMLDSRLNDVSFTDLGPLDLKGITNPVPAVDIVYEHDPMALLRKLPFVGRADEYDTLVESLTEARNGRGRVVLMAGEPGIGKTRLTEEFCEQAAATATVIRGNCYEGDVAAPFGPWTEALRSLITQTPHGDLEALLGPGAPDVSVLVPEVRRRLPDLAAPPRLDPESERARLFESIAVLLRNAAERQPLVIFLDDLHWCDRPSLALVEQIARRCVDQRIIIVATYRDVEVDRQHPLAQTLAALRRFEHHVRLAIRGFDHGSISDLLRAIEPADEAEPARVSLAAMLEEESEGNPFFIREVLSSLVETGELVHRDGVWTRAATASPQQRVPEGVREIIGRRLLRLSDECIRMLRQASAMTSGITWAELCAISGEPEDRLLDALDEALAAQLFEERDGSSYRFTHALVRSALYDELSAPRRSQLHRRIGEALEALYADDLDEHLSELAAHFVAADSESPQAVSYSIRAGDRAQQLFAWEEGAMHYQRALQSRALSSGDDPKVTCGVVLALAECNTGSGRMAESVEPLRMAATLARRIPAAELFARTANAFDRVAEGLEEDLTSERLELLDEALAMLGDEDSALKAFTLATRARAAAAVANARAGLAAFGAFAMFGARDEAILAQAREAVAMAERVGDDDVIVWAITNLHQYASGPDNDEEQLALIERAVEAAQRAQSMQAESRAYGARGDDLLQLGDMEEFRRNAERCADLADRLRIGVTTAVVMQVGVEVAEGKLEAAEARLDGYAGSAAHVSHVFSSIVQRYFIRHMQGRLSEMEAMWRGMVDRMQQLPLVSASLAWTLACTGSFDEAETELTRLAHDDLAGIPRDNIWRPTVNTMADACAEIEARALAPVLYAAVSPYAGRVAALAPVLPLGSMARVCGRLATLLERWDEAEGHFQMALAHNSRMCFSAWEAWTKLNYGDMLLRRNAPGDTQRAMQMLQEARAFATQSGMGKVLADSDRLLTGAC